MYTVIIVPTQVSSLEFLSTFFRNVLSLNWHYPTTAIQDSTRYNTAYLVMLGKGLTDITTMPTPKHVSHFLCC